jgi:peptide-methionine (S)-S-oxide reductase
MTRFVLGGGCFWCLDALYRQIKGVSEVESGYAGGEGEPNYYKVATGKTGHAEVVRVTFDESIIPVEIILDIFFVMHNPTTLNRQGADVGTEYRSIMLYENQSQQEQFQAALERAQKIWDTPIVTEVVALETFYLAEEEHQNFFAKNPESGYCAIVIEPKLIKARAHFKQWFKEESA